MNITFKRFTTMAALAAALGLGSLAAPAEAKTSVYLSVGVGTPVSYDDYYEYLPRRAHRPRMREVGEYYHAPRWRYRPRQVRVFKQVCERRVRVVRKWSYRKQRWVKRTWYGPQRCWRVRIR